MKYVTFLIALSILPLLGCSDGGPLEVTSPGSQLDTATPARVDVERPFAGHWRTTFGPPGSGVSGCDGNEATGIFEINGIGIATDLGRNTFVSESESDFVTQCGHTVHTAANGDLLEFDFAGTVDASEFPDISFSGEFWFTGGTGRFANATGGGTYEGTGNAIIGEGEVSNIGTIVY